MTDEQCDAEDVLSQNCVHSVHWEEPIAKEEAAPLLVSRGSSGITAKGIGMRKAQGKVASYGRTTGKLF